MKLNEKFLFKTTNLHFKSENYSDIENSCNERSHLILRFPRLKQISYSNLRSNNNRI